MAHVKTRNKTEGAVRAAVELAYLTAKMDQALPVSPASVHALARP